MGTEPDLLRGARWDCAATPPGEAADPAGLAGLPLRWIPADVPGTAAGALRGSSAAEPSSAELDAEDWWYRCRFAGPGPAGGAGGGPGPWLLELAGLATVSDVWLNGEHVAHSESMFAPCRTRVEALRPRNELAIRCAALTPLLAERRPRPRWKTAGASHQNLRWWRTTLLGRQPGWTVTPAPVGPWRPVSLRPWASHQLVHRFLDARPSVTGRGGTGGSVSVEMRCTTGPEPVMVAAVEVGGVSVPLTVELEPDGEHLVARAALSLPAVEPWWPHTHGAQPLYPVSATIGSARFDLGQVGFRTVEVDDHDGGFQLVVNGTPVFCRGGCWYPVDPVSFAPSAEETAATLALARDAGMNMVRIPGGTVYEDDRFFSACDRLGIMVWQDAMFAFLDPPDDEGFMAGVTDELDDVFSGLAGHPSVSVVCGGQELEEQPAMFGLSPDRWRSTLTEKVVPAIAGQRLAGVPYVTSSPTGGDLPFQVDAGVCHYTGVGVFGRPLSDLRRAAPRFVSEGLAFAVPPPNETVDGHCGGARRAGHDPTWKQAIHHDTGGSWDLEDVRHHYVHLLFGEDPALVRRHDPERALDLGRAAVAHVMAEAVAEWRRPASPCAGLLLVGWRDLRTGAGWGVIDALGRPKAPWFALARACQPVAVLLTDEGLNGLSVHLVNDRATAVSGRLVLSLFSGDHCLETAERGVAVPARGGTTVSSSSLFDGFRDVTYAYRFGPRHHELVVARLLDEEGSVLSRATYLPGGPSRPVQSEIGLQAGLELTDDQVWSLSVSTRRFAQFVAVDVPGFRAADSWFHLEPGGTQVTRLYPERAPEPARDGAPIGQVRALNSVEGARVSA
jgi:beta-mannosidase